MPHILGRGGSKVNKLKDAHSVRIDVEDASEVAIVTLEGSKDSCLAVQNLMLETADDTVGLFSTKT